MDSDDDFQSFSPPVQHPMLKRLRKAIFLTGESEDRATSVHGDVIASPRVDPDNFAGLDASDSEVSIFKESDEPRGWSQSPSGDCDVGNELKSDFDNLGFEDYRKGTKRGLEFDDASDEIDLRGADRSDETEDETTDLVKESCDKKRVGEGKSIPKEKKKRKEVEDVGCDDAKPKKSSTNKRREEMERKAYIQQLHAESQRLLRETREASFKPIQVVHKPISAVLEKIRQRKLEVLKKPFMLSNSFSMSEEINYERKVMIDLDVKNVSRKDRGVTTLPETVEEETVAHCGDVDSRLNDSQIDGSKEDGSRSSSQRNAVSEMVLDRDSMLAFRAPLDDTQDLFGDYETSDSKDALPSLQQNAPMEEIMPSALLAMDLKFDDDRLYDSSSDEEDNDKENTDPHPPILDMGSSPNGDPVKDFVDDEAVEEDDSDNDMCRFQENEDDDDEDSEELNDIIATGYKERPSDAGRRNELHQEWFEQADAAGTENLLQRLKGLKSIDSTVPDEEEDDDENEEEKDAKENAMPASLLSTYSKKAKQMIAQMFSDKDDAFLSDDENETEKMLVKQQMLVRSEDQVTLLSPAEDETSREVFGLIKKLNVVSDTRKNAKASSFFDSLPRGNSNSSSKSSFLGRVSGHSFPSSNKQGSSMVRSFIFGREDSNSRSSLVSEDSSDTVLTESPPMRTVTKFSSCQARPSSQSTNSAAYEPCASLFEVLKRSSMQSNALNQEESMSGLSQSVFAAFRLPKESRNIQGRRLHVGRT